MSAIISILLAVGDLISMIGIAKDVGRDEQGRKSRDALVSDLKVIIPISVLCIPVTIGVTLYWDLVQQWMPVVGTMVIAVVLVLLAILGLRQLFSRSKSQR